jgi:hypothetical protein
MRAAAHWVRGALNPYAVATVVDGTFVRVCANHDEPALVCKGCDWFDAGTTELAALMVALLNARGPLRSLLEVMASQLAQEGPQPRGAMAYAFAARTARALRGEVPQYTQHPECCRCDPVLCETDDTGDHCATAGCAYCQDGCPATGRPCCKATPTTAHPVEQGGADMLLDHIQQCHPEVDALVASQSGPLDVAELERAGWTVERTEYVAGKRIRIMRAPGTQPAEDEPAQEEASDA